MSCASSSPWRSRSFFALASTSLSKRRRSVAFCAAIPGCLSRSTGLSVTIEYRGRSGLGCRRRRQALGAGARDIGVGGFAARHDRKAAALDEPAAVPSACLAELDELDGNIALGAEALDADRGQRRHVGVVGSDSRPLVRTAAGHPAAPAETDYRGRDRADDRTLDPRLRVGWNIHESPFAPGVRADAQNRPYATAQPTIDRIRKSRKGPAILSQSLIPSQPENSLPMVHQVYTPAPAASTRHSAA